MILIPAFIILVLMHSLVSRRLERTILTAPMLFTLAGVLLFSIAPARKQPEMHFFLQLSEIALVLILFADASRTDLGFLKSIRNLPARLLTTGMLLTIVLGIIVAKLIFPALSIWEAGILSAILAPTDAGLGMVIVKSPRVPMRIRQALNVEAGLNDGLSVPFLLFFIAMARAGQAGTQNMLVRYMVEQLGYGVAVGVAIGVVGGWLLHLAHRKGWAEESQLQLGVLTLPVLCILASEAVGASMFIAAFVGGLAVQVGFPDAGKHSVEFTEQWGQVLSFAVFFLFGMIAARLRGMPGGELFVYAVLSLTVIRMLPVAISLIGTHLQWPTTLFMGWFGPRGLASIVLGLVFIEHEARLPGESTITVCVILTVLLSIFVHGATALPGISLYAQKTGAEGDTEENATQAGRTQIAHSKAVKG